MLDTKEVWEKFKTYPWWLKILVFIPMVLLVLIIGVAIVFLSTQDIEHNPYTVTQGKKIVEKKVKENEQLYEEVKKEHNKIAVKQEELDKEIENVQANYNDVIDSIDDAADDELSSLATKIRRDRASKDNT